MKINPKINPNLELSGYPYKVSLFILLPSIASLFFPRILLLCFGLGLIYPLFGQVKSLSGTGGGGTPINFTSDKADFQKINGKTIGYLRSQGNPCRFYQGNAVMTSDSAILYQDENKLTATGHVVIHQADTITITGERLYYDGNTRLAKLYDHITMTDRQGVLTTDHLDYDLNTRVGTYYDGGRITNKDNILLSRTGYYYENTKVAYFKTKVTILTPQTTINSDTLQYNTLSRIAYFFGPTRIQGKDDFIYCENGEYNTGNDRAQFSKHAYYLNGSKRLSGDSLYYDKRVGYGRAVKNVIFRDTVEKALLYGGLAVYDKTTELTYATLKPFFVFLTQTDDTLNTYPDTLLNPKPNEKKLKKETKTELFLVNHKILSKPLPNPTSISEAPGRVILDTLLVLNPEKGGGKKSKLKPQKLHLVRRVVEKIDSLFLTADTLKTAVVTGDWARPHLFTKTLPQLRKTRFDSLDKKAVRLLGEIRKDVIQDSLKKLPGYKAPLSRTGVELEKADSIIKKIPPSQSRLPIRDPGANGVILKTKPPKIEHLTIGLPDSTTRKRVSRKPLSDSLSRARRLNHALDSLPLNSKMSLRLPPSKKGFFSRLFSKLFSAGNSLPISSDSLARKKQDSLEKRARISIPFLLKGIPENVEKDWKFLFSTGKKRMIRYEDTAHYRIIFAFNKARLYKSDFQSAADSMVYTYFDSTLRCFKNPVMWTEGSQMTADTISLSLKNRKLDSLAMIRSAFIISKVDSINKEKFHQISGRNMFGRFKNNSLVRLLVEGNGKSLYYAEEEKKDTLSRRVTTTVIGLNSTIASYFIIGFKQNKPSRINAIENPISHFYPTSKLSPGKERLTGFNWRESERPKSKIDIFRRPSIQEMAQDTLVNKKSLKLDSLDDSNPNILEGPRIIPKKLKTKPPFNPSNNPKGTSFPKKYFIKPVFGLLSNFSCGSKPVTYEKFDFLIPGSFLKNLDYGPGV